MDESETVPVRTLLVTEARADITNTNIFGAVDFFGKGRNTLGIARSILQLQASVGAFCLV